MSAQNGPDEAARLEMALSRIARAVSRPRAPVPLHDGAAQATHPRSAESAAVAARLDHLIAEIRAVLGPHDF
jgi:hypothetical protein